MKFFLFDGYLHDVFGRYLQIQSSSLLQSGVNYNPDCEDLSGFIFYIPIGYGLESRPHFCFKEIR